VKSAFAVLGLGLAALIVQGALARTISPPWCPDLAWLVVVGVGLRWPGFLSGLFVAVPLGYAMDLLSGSLMGQHALMRILSYLTAALASRQLDLSGGLSTGIFVFGLSLAYGVGIAATLSFFVGSDVLSFDLFGKTIAHAVINVIAAGPMIGLVERVLTRFSDDEVGRQSSLPMGFQGRGIG
jgi:rod shape-determining protein MreD